MGPCKMQMLWNCKLYPAVFDNVLILLFLPAMAADYKATCIIHPGNHFLFCNTASRHGAETGSMVLGRNAALRVHSIGTLLFYMLLLFTIGVLYEYLRLLPAQLESALRSSESYKTKLRSSSDVTRTPLLSERERSSSPSLYNTYGTGSNFRSKPANNILAVLPFLLVRKHCDLCFIQATLPCRACTAVLTYSLSALIFSFQASFSCSSS